MDEPGVYAVHKHLLAAIVHTFVLPASLTPSPTVAAETEKRYPALVGAMFVRDEENRE